MAEKKEEVDIVLYFEMPDGTPVRIDPEIVERYQLNEGDILPFTGYTIKSKSKTRGDALKPKNKLSKATRK